MKTNKKLTSALVPVFLILLPFNALRVRWSYINGVIVHLGLFAGLLKSVVDQAFFFSLSPDNLKMIAVFLCAAASIHFSLRSYLELPPLGWVKSALGIGILVAVSVLPSWLVSINQMETKILFLSRPSMG